MTRDMIYRFETLVAQMRSLHVEIGAFAGKRPHDAVNAFKLKLANVLLATANGLLGEERIPLRDFCQFDIDNVPTNSDVVVILAQYLSVLEQLRSENIYQNGESWFWYEDESEDGDDGAKDDAEPIETSPPKKLKC